MEFWEFNLIQWLTMTICDQMTCLTSGLLHEGYEIKVKMLVSMYGSSICENKSNT
jgi:hypothetical protein